ncbi:hypothetical protein DRN44_08725 [Thermococci archaeon]|nr:MAG: hypothetical protein DRN44_08725 [Thermococci archaeon]
MILCLLIFIATLPNALAETPEIIIEVNPNLELFAAVYILAFNGSDPFIIAPQSYISDILDYFAPYKDHPAVYLVRDALPQDLPHYRRDYSINEFAASLVSKPYLGNMSENDLTLSDFYRSLISFAKESNFMGFYKRHAKEYEEVLEPARKALTQDIFQKFEELFGSQYGAFHIALSYSLRIHPGSSLSGILRIILATLLLCLSNMPRSFTFIWLFMSTLTHLSTSLFQSIFQNFQNWIIISIKFGVSLSIPPMTHTSIQTTSISLRTLWRP